MSQLEIENDKTRIQLGECQWQKDKTEENLDKISEAVDLTINKCKVYLHILSHWLTCISLTRLQKITQEIIESKEKTIDSLQTKLDIYESSVNKIIHNNMCIE